MTIPDRIERDNGPDRALDAEIAVALRVPHPLGQWVLNFPDWEVDHTDKGRVWAVGNINGNGNHRSGSWYSNPYTASIDAAMTLARDENEASDLLYEALERLGQTGWPTGKWVQAIPRFISAAALRGRKDQP